MSYSTQSNIYHTPQKNNTKIVGKYLRYPANKDRKAEGGLRTQGKYKHSKKDKPLFSIITVTYNAQRYLEQCILSVLEQDYDNVEYIIIDGGSTDSTLDIIKKYENAIDYYISEPDAGIYEAMNKGLSLASGDAINFMNADDYFLPNVFSKYVERLVHKNAKVVHSYVDIYNRRGKFFMILSTTIFESLFAPIGHQSLFVHNTIFEKAGKFDSSYDIAADTKCVAHVFFEVALEDIAIIEESCVAYRLGGISDLRQSESMQEFQRIQKELFSNKFGISLTLQQKIRNEEFQENIYSEMLKVYNEQIENKNIFEKVMISLGAYLEQSRISEYKKLLGQKIQLENNIYYKFGQLSRKKKILFLFKISLLIVPLIVKRILSKIKY